MAMLCQNTAYLNLPGEVRNQIMGYVLMPGNVHPRVALSVPAKKRASNSKSTWNVLMVAIRGMSLECIQKVLLAVICRVLSGVFAPFFAVESRRKIQPGFQLLATCKQVRLEGRGMFYGTNIFHLPHGPLEDTLKWYDKLNAEHQALIKHVQLTLSLADLTPMVLEGLDTWNLIETDECFSAHHATALFLRTQVWKQKMDFLRAWKGLDSVYIKIWDHDCSLQSGNLRGFAERYSNGILRLAGRKANAELRNMINATGWEATRASLAVRGKEGCV